MLWVLLSVGEWGSQGGARESGEMGELPGIRAILLASPFNKAFSLYKTKQSEKNKRNYYSLAGKEITQNLKTIAGFPCSSV